MNDLNDSLPTCREDTNTVEDLRLELDQSELKQRQLTDKIQQLGDEAAELRSVVVELQKQLDVSLSAQEKQQGLHGELKALQAREEALSRELEVLRNTGKNKEVEQQVLQEKLLAAEGKNIELLAKLDEIVNEKGQQAASHFDSAQKIHELLDNLKDAEHGKIEAVAELEEKKRHLEKLEEELRVKDAVVKDGEAKLAALSASAAEEKAMLESELMEKCSTFDKLQGALTVREKEASNLQKQLQDLQRSLEEKMEQVEEVKRKANLEKAEMMKDTSNMKESFEAEVGLFREKLMKKESEHNLKCETLQQLEAKNLSLTGDIEKFTSDIMELECSVKEQASKTEDYKRQCDNLMELNEKLLNSVKKNDELMKEMAENRLAQENELAALRSSEKHFRGQLDDAKISVDEKEKLLREENRKLDEGLQKANSAAVHLEAASQRLEQENQSLREEQETVKAALSRMQADLRSVHGQIGDLEKNLGASRKNEASLQEQLQAKEMLLESKEKDMAELQTRISALEIAKTDVEKTCSKQTEMLQRATSERQLIETSQLEKSAIQEKQSQEAKSKLARVEGQLDVSLKDTARLQEEILELCVQAKRLEEDKLGWVAQLELTAAQRDELRTLTERLKAQVEALNQNHIKELMECKNKERELSELWDKEVAAHAELAITAAALREDLSTHKAESARLAAEGNEAREALHRANTEMAEMGIALCKLSAEKDEVTGQWEGDVLKAEELEKEVERIESVVEKLQLENNRLREELAEREKLPEAISELQRQLEKAKKQSKKAQDSSREEVKAIKFQMSSENMNHQTMLKVSDPEHYGR